MSQLQVIARYTIGEGNESAVLALLPRLEAASRLEPGNVSYDVFTKLGDGRDVVILERYASPAAFAAHRETEHFRDIGLAQIIPLLASRVVDSYPVPVADAR